MMMLQFFQIQPFHVASVRRYTFSNMSWKGYIEHDADTKAKWVSLVQAKRFFAVDAGDRTY